MEETILDVGTENKISPACQPASRVANKGRVSTGLPLSIKYGSEGG